MWHDKLYDPLTLIAAGTAISAGAGIGGAVMGFQQAAFNRKVAQQNADAATAQAAADEERLRRDRVRKMGTLRAQMGAQGGTFGGSALDILADEAAEAELDALNVRAGGAARARNFGVQASAAGQQGIASIVGGVGNVGGTLLTGTSAYIQAKRTIE